MTYVIHPSELQSYQDRHNRGEIYLCGMTGLLPNGTYKLAVSETPIKASFAPTTPVPPKPAPKPPEPPKPAPTPSPELLTSPLATVGRSASEGVLAPVMECAFCTSPL